MNEIVDMIYQWHQGAGIKSIQRSLGFHRKTIRKYVALAQSVGVSRGGTFPQESIPFLVEIKERLPLSFALLPVKRFSGPLMCRSLVAR